MGDAERLGAVLAGGVGLAVAAGANLLLPTRRGRVAVALVALLLIPAVVGAWASDPSEAAVSAGLIAAGLALGSARVAAAVGRPAVRWGLLVVLGAAAAGGSVATLEVETAALAEKDEAELRGAIEDRPATAPAPVAATTDRGTPVPVLVATDPRSAPELTAAEDRAILTPRRGGMIRRGPADERTNCHGWVFAGGQFWVPGEAVELILSENGYRPVADPRPGDLAVYRRGGAVVHTAVVRYAAAADVPALVEGKWGSAGVYLHAPDESLYGADFVFYRSARDGHLLAGLGGPSPDAPADDESEADE